MPKDKRKFRDIAGDLVAPGGPSASASEFPVDYMEKRDKKLRKLKKKSGGMFDIIYRGRKSREAALDSIDY